MLLYWPPIAKMYQAVIFRCVLFSLFCWSCQAADCPGIEGHLNRENIVNYQGCSKVMGNIVINQASFQSDPAVTESVAPLTMEELSILNNIIEVDGYVQVENTNHEELTNLRFLRNLETIYGHETFEVFPNQHYSLIISGNSYLQTLNLASLKKIENGGVRIISNPQLCLIDTISVEDYLIGSTLNRIGDYAEDCSAVSCHEQCEMSGGCWGTLADECVQCRSYNYQGTCVEACDEYISYADDESMTCIPLPTTSTVTTRRKPSTTPHPSNTHSSVNNTATEQHNREDEANVTVVTEKDVTATLIAETMSNTFKKWLPPLIILIIGFVAVIVAIIGVVYKYKTRKTSKAVIKRHKTSTAKRDTKVIQVVGDGTASHSASARLGGDLLTRRQHVLCSKVSVDDSYDQVNDAASPEPEVVVISMMDTVNKMDCEEDRYTRMPYEHDIDLNATLQSQSHMTPSHDSHMTDSEHPVYDTIDLQPSYESAASTRHERGLTRSTGSDTSKQTASSSTAVIKLRSPNHTSRSSFQHSLTMGAVYSTRTTTSRQSSSHTHHPSVSHRGSLTSSSNQTAGGQRTAGRASRMSHRLSTTGGSMVSNTTTGTSTRQSVNSIMTMHE